MRPAKLDASIVNAIFSKQVFFLARIDFIQLIKVLVKTMKANRYGIRIVMIIMIIITRGSVTPRTCGSWSVGRLVEGRSVGRGSVGRKLIGRSVNRSFGRSDGRLVGRSIGRSVGQSVGQTVGWSRVGQLAGDRLVES